MARLIAGLCLGLLPAIAFAQGRGAAGRGGPPPAPRQAASIDITGNWVAVITQDWRFRMVMPAKGDYAGLPINAAARKAADGWDPARDAAGGEQCRAYGAANIMRMPVRLRIAWRDDQTLTLETDAGMQTRTFSFTAAPAAPSWQGTSQARWDVLPGRGRGQAPIGAGLKVVTTNLRPGYLRTNGVPYSAGTVLTEYYDRIDVPNGEPLLIVTTTVEDPMYLTEPYLYATHFKRERDGSGWRPRACGVR